MSKVKDEKGKRYGKLLVLERAGSTSGGIAKWLCQCDCGNKTEVMGSKLRKGLTVSCGCWGKNTGKLNFKDLTGKKFGLLTVKKRVENIKKYVAFLCECECGNSVIVQSRYLKSGSVISCGCKRSSAGELLIEQLLLKNNIIFEKEKTFKDLVSIKDKCTPYRFDFYLPEYNRLIEFDGLQHITKQADNYFNRTLEEVQEIDKIKNNYAKEKHIELVRIPYSKIKTLVIDDLLKDKFLVV